MLDLLPSYNRFWAKIEISEIASTERVRLCQGEEVLIRPIRLDDTDWIKEIYLGLSAESRTLRFNGALANISPSFWDQLAEQTAQAAVKRGFGVLVFEEDRSRLLGLAPIGIARYVETSQRRAEIALAISDRYQAHGIGRRLMQRLIQHAKRSKINLLEAYVSPQNVGMQKLILSSGLPYYAREMGCMHEYQLILR